MKNESQKNNIFENSFQITSQENKKDKDLSTSYVDYNERKNEGCNDWNSVPKTYDKEESCQRHEKTATNNQWCSTNK